MDVPLLAGLFQGLIAQDGAAPTGAAHRQLHGQDGDAHDEQADQVEQDKVAAAVLTSNVREAPDVADPDGAACTDQQEAKAGAEIFSFHDFLSSFSQDVLILPWIDRLYKGDLGMIR